jgi:Meiotically Up-regulated Gene 113 (MUG113) protein
VRGRRLNQPLEAPIGNQIATNAEEPNQLDRVVYFETWPQPIVNGLKYWRVRTWRDLCSLGEAHLLIIHGVGRSEVNFVRQRLADVGLRFEGWLGTVRGAIAKDLLPTTRPTCGVYFIRCGPFVKIGFATNVSKRFMAIQLGCPLEMELVGLVPCSTAADARALECRLHEQFSAQRHRLEWFRLDRDICRFIAETKPIAPE